MAINFPDSPSNGDTTTLANKTYTYDSSKSKWSPSGGITLSALSVGSEATASGDGAISYNGAGVFSFTPAVAAGTGVTVHASQSAMVAADASSAVTEGSLHYDTGANKLYVKMADAASGGFYLLASIINASPAISSPSTGTSFTLDGSPNPTTISIAATDSDAGQTLNYYYTVSTGSIGSGTTVTTSATSGGTYASSGNAVAGSSNASTNSHFRINPSNSVATSFSLTFYVTDGTNISNTICSFTLAFQIQNSRHTSLLMSANAAGTNSTFSDSSSSGHTITPSGDPTQGSFTPYRKGSYSVEFDGSGDYLSAPTSSDFSFGTGDFTVECWFTKNALSHAGIWQISSTSSGLQSANYGTTLALGYQSGVMQIYGAGNSTTASHSIVTGKFYHAAYVRSSGVSKLYIDGTEIISQSDTTNYSHTNMVIGGYYTTSYLHAGKISNLRVVKGTAVYTSNFTPPTAPLTAVTNTKLLACSLPHIADANTQVAAKTITPSGNTKTAPSGPFDYGQSVVTDGGSISLDGSDYLSVATSTDFNMTNQDFNISFWYYRTATGTYQTIASQLGTWALEFVSDNLKMWMSSGTSANWDLLSEVTITPSDTNLNVWNYISIVRDSSAGTLKCYKNGSVVYTNSSFTGTVGSSTNPIRIGDYSGHFYIGSIADFRMMVGSDLSSVSTSVPTSALTNATNTKLLVKGQGAKVFDKSQTGNVGLNSAVGVQATNVTTPAQINSGDFANTFITDCSSATKYVTVPDNGGLVGAFTIETYMYITESLSGTGLKGIIGSNPNASGAGYMCFEANGTKLDFYTGTGTGNAEPIWNNLTIPQNSWFHFAVQRSATNYFSLYINGTKQTSGDNNYARGTQAASGTVFNNNLDDLYYITRWNSNNASLSAYLQDFRITDGLERYTTNFTPHTEPLKG